MDDYLIDLQTRDIYIKLNLGITGVFNLGDKVFEILKNLIYQQKVIGAFFTHYYDPPNTLPHVKVGIRYDKISNLMFVSSILDGLCEENKNIVTDKGRFEKTTGKFQHFSQDIIVDYVACISFNFLLKAKEDIGNKLPLLDDMVNWFLHHQIKITNSIIKSKDIFRLNKKFRRIKKSEIEWIWERFVHHFLNSYRSSRNYEARLKYELIQNEIPIH